MINHSNRQPIGRKFIVFLDELPNVKNKNNMWVHKETDPIGIDDKMREEKARVSSEGIVIAMAQKAFKDEEFSPEEMPRIGDRVAFKTWSGQHTCEGDMFYRTLEDKEMQHYYIPQRGSLLKKTKTKKK